MKQSMKMICLANTSVLLQKENPSFNCKESSIFNILSHGVMDILCFGKRQYEADILYFMSGSEDVVRSHSSVSSMGGSPGDVSEEPVTWRSKRRVG